MSFSRKQSAAMKSNVCHHMGRAFACEQSSSEHNVLSLRALPLALAVALHANAAFAELPVPSSNFINAGQGLAVMQSDGVNMVINQQSDRVILNWDQFNVGSGNSVTYNQPSSGSVALNRIFQGDPSKILGAINANGQVYLYNQNGIIFGEGSKINVGSLVATTLNIDDSQFLQGALTNAIENGQAAFFDITGDNKGIIEIQPGAEINANDPNGGRILVIASEIVNGGTLSSPDGQTILAASSDKVYLAASDKDPNLRGLLVEVQTGGSVTNLGSIIADRGNITMIGLAVNQSGHVRATTSVSKNGSIRLLARDNAIVKNSATFTDDESLQAIGIEGLIEKPTAGKLAVAQTAGSVILGTGSVTEVVPDDDAVTAAPDAQEQFQSKVEIVGKEIWLQPDAAIVAPSGKVKITATTTPATTAISNINDSTYVYLDEGSRIDVSGTDTTVLAMERNSLAVEVRSNELADSPLQRGGVLQGQTVYVDLSKGTDIIDYSGALANVEKTVSERLVKGGDIEIKSAGDVVQLQGSVMDVSGGTISYNPGFIKETQLISENRVYDLSDADKNRSYDAILGVETVTHERWAVTETFTGFSGLDSGRYVDSFVEGRDAGNVNITAASVLLAADGIKADVTVGPYQLDPFLLPEAGTLDIDLRTLTGSTQGVSFLAELLVDEITGDLANAPDPSTLQRDAITTNLVLPDSYLQHSGLGTLRIDSNGEVFISDTAVINANAGTTIDLTGSAVNMDGHIISHSGEVQLQAIPVVGYVRADLFIGENAVIDTTGLWINESEIAAITSTAAATAHLIDGGGIYLQAEGDVAVAQGALLNASAGALLDAGYAVSAGQGGDISLIANQFNGSSVKLEGELQSYALFDGGSLDLEAASIYVGDAAAAPAQPNQIVIAPAFFERGGFGEYRLTANAGDLIVDSIISPVTQNLTFKKGEVITVGETPTLAENILLTPTGTSLQSMTEVATLTDELRHSVDLEFNLQQTQTDKNHNLVVSDEAVISLDKGASLKLNADTSIHIAGIINAPAGDVELNIHQPDIETGFLANQGIWLAAGSEINARSASLLTANDQGLRIGEALDAGSVTLAADRGYVIIQDGASIDVSADALTLDMLQSAPGGGTQYQAVEVAPDAGRISLSAAEGVIIDGDLHADAAAVSGATVNGARGGTLDVAIDVGNRGIDFDGNNSLPSGQLKFNFGPRDIIMSADSADRLSPALQPGDVIDSDLNGKAYVDIAKVIQAGFDTLTLTTSNTISNNFAAASEIRFETDVQLNLSNSLVLNAPTINVNNHDVALTAAYINLGTDSNTRNTVSTTPVSGSGHLMLNAALLDVLGDIDISGNETFVVNAGQDLRFIGAISSEDSDHLHGSLNTSADISIIARQIYPTTLSQFSIKVLNKPDGRIAIAKQATDTATEAAPVLSAAGSLSLNAAVIEQGGVVKAPLGQLAFNATDNIQLLPGSLTSVSAGGAIIPFGTTVDSGSSWTYTLDAKKFAGELPQKSVELQAPSVAIGSDAVVDLSAGGDAYAWEFVSGPSGKSDVLQRGTVGVYAVLPESGSQYAPYDPLLTDETIGVGDQVYLSAGSGLDAGFYPLLPARYALLPGAKLVTELNGINGIYPGKTITRADGVSIVAGKYAVANSGIIDSTWSAFVVEDGSVVHTRSQYIETLASDFFSSHSPLDAGSMVIEATDSLSLAGMIKGDHADGTQGSHLDILADNIEVVDVAGVASSGFIQLTGDELNQLDVASMMLGGRRSSDGDVTNISVKAGNIVIRENARITTPELLLVATDTIEMKSGASLDGSGAASSGVVESYVLDNNASVVAVSVNPLAEVKRSGSGAGAEILLADGSSLSADNSIIIDSSKNVQFDGVINVDGGGVRLGANRINLGDVPASTDGLNLRAADLAGLNVEQLVISSFESLGIYEDVALSFNNLELITPGINGISATGSTVSLLADGNITLRQNGELATAAGAGNNTLNVQAGNILLAGGDKDFTIDGIDKDFAFDGFYNVMLKAMQSVRGVTQESVDQGAAAFDFAAADVVIDAPLIHSAAGSSLTVTTSGNVSLRNTAAAVVDTAAVTNLGGQLRVDAKAIDVATNLVFPSGLIALNSSGTAADDNVTLNSDALLDVSGRTMNYIDGSVAGSSAGRVELGSANGNIDAQAGSLINLASSAVAGDAGRLQLSVPNGSVMLNGSIESSHAAGFAGAKFDVDVDQLLDVASLMQAVQSAGFTGSQNYRIRNGDIAIAALAGGEANIKASDIVIAADNGSITLSGRLDSSGEQAGSVALYAGNDVVLTGAVIDASARLDETGGKVIFGTASGAIAADSATQIDVAGAGNNTSGKVTLRAPRTSGNSDVAIIEFSAAVSGAEHIDIEGVAVYNDSVIGSSQQNIYRNEAQSWLGNSAAMASRLGLAADSRVRYLPGVEVASNTNITISNAVDFYQWQVDSANVIDEGTFTIRAGNNLNINASISDVISDELLWDFGYGFSSALVPVLKAGDSWNYRLVSGGDLNAANPMAVNRDSDTATGNMRLASGVAVRTGNGDIEISSGGNLVLADQTSVIYTAGQPNDGKYDAVALDFSGLPDGPQFADNGGDIVINVAENIAGAISSQYFTDWLQRLATLDGAPIPAMWGVVLNDFEQGIATLGGGDISVSAGGNISNLSLSTPRTGQLDVNDNVVIRGGGDIDVIAGGDYLSGRLLADGGSARIRVGGDIVAAENGLQTLLAMGDTQLRIEAGGDIGIGGIANVTMLPMSTKQSNSTVSVNSVRNYFFTYGDDSRVELVSDYGDIVIDNNIDAISSVPNNLVTVSGGNTYDLWSVYPGDFSATALDGNIQINDSFSLYPDADGNLQLLAAGDIVTGDIENVISVLLSDAAVTELPDIYAADYNLYETDLRLLGDSINLSARHDFNAPVHQDDASPVRVVANGDIAINDPLKLVLSKKSLIYAGGDITDLAVDIQNLKATDKSLVVAGGDIRYVIPDSSVSSFVSGGIKVTGPGSIDVIAGGDIDLGISKGIRSLGNVDNSVLPEQGAVISVYAGSAAELDSTAFIATYFSGSDEGDAALIDIDVAAYQQQLIDYVQSPAYNGDLASSVTAVTAVEYSDRESAIAAFNQLDETQRVAVAIDSFSNSSSVEQQGLLLNVLFNEMNLAASEQAASGNEEAYARGFLAIDRLFHTADETLANNIVASGGNISLPFSRILSTSGGEINLLAPNGELNVGFTAEVKNSSDDAGALGVIVSGKGDLSALTEGNINVNLARMLTLDGGDISLWSSSGDIDAGRGAKSELTIPPPLTIVDKLTGQIKVIFPPAVSGSGIGAASFSLGQAPGKVTLAAPGGVINASDAGIRSDGDLVLAATKVLGADNISAGGTSVGIPIATNVTAGLSGLSSSTDSAIKGASDSISSATADAAASDGVALVTVELLGTGEEQDQ